MRESFLLARVTIFIIFLLVICALAFSCGFQNPTTPSPETPNQALAIKWSSFYAAKVGVRLDAVIFPEVLEPISAAAVAECSAHIIAFRKSKLETFEEATIRALAAHEVCHIMYKDNLPCKPPYDEDRAERCAQEIL